MRKFTLLFAFLLSLIGVAQAQTVITDLNSLSNGKVYTLTGERGTLLTFDGATMLYGTFAGDRQGVAYVASDPYQQFAILKSEGGDLYLYNVGLKKFINQGNNCYSLSTYPSHKFEATNASNQDGDYDWLVKVNGQMINLSGSDGGHNTGVNVGYSTEDSGNRFAITEVGTLDDAVKAEVEALINWKATTLPTLSTDAEPVYYSIKNLRSNKYAAHQYTGSRLVQTADEANAGALWYFVDASSSVPEGTTLGEGVLPVYIKNMATGMRIKSADAATYGDDARIWYLIPHTATHTGYVITAGTEVSNWTSWNDAAGSTVCHYLGNDAGSIWAFVPTLSAVANTAKAGVPALITNELNAVQTSAIAEAEALGARPYYSYSTDDVNTCKNTINGIAVTTYAEFLTAKTTIAEALTTLKACTTINPIAGSEYVKIRNYNASSCYMKVKTTETTNEETSEVTTTRTVFDETSVGEESIWTFLAKSDNTGFYLYNPLTALYVKHTGGGNVALVSSQDEASVYSITPEKNYVKIHVGTGNRDYLHHQQDGNVVCWSSDAASSWWYIEKPTDAEIEALNKLLTPVADLVKAERTALENKMAALKTANQGLEFYVITTESIDACQEQATALLDAVTTHAQLASVQAQIEALVANLEANRTNPIEAGDKIKFNWTRDTGYYLTTNVPETEPANANNATEAWGWNKGENLNKHSVWEVVANADGTGFYLYNVLSGKYLQHPAAQDAVAKMVSEQSEATVYNFEFCPVAEGISPETSGVKIYTNNGTGANDVLFINGSGKVVSSSTEAARAYFTPKSATEDLTEDIAAAANAALDAYKATVAATVEQYKNLEFYRPTQAIDAYEAAIATITGVDTYDELAAALEAITAAQTAFETAIAADDVVLANPVANGTRVKFINRENSNFWITSDGQTLGGKLESELETTSAAVLELVESEDAEKPGFYLYHPLTNKYVKHPAGNETIATMVDKADADVYTITPVAAGLFVNIGKGTGGSDYLHGVTRNGVYKVFQWDATTPASHWTVQTISTEDLDEDIAACVGAQFDAYKQLAADTVAMYQGLTYYTASEAALAAYNEAVNGITVPTDYASLPAAQAAVSTALQTFKAAERANPLTADMHVKFVNKANPALWMNTNAGGVTAEAAEGLETIWTLKANNENTGFYLLNELEGKYVKHPEANGNQATLVDDMAEASLYRIQPNGFHINLVTDVDAEENSLHYGAERYVTRWIANHDASLWNFEVVSAEQFQALLAHDLDSCKQLALLRIGVAAKSAFYAPTADAISAAQTSVEAVDAAAVATLADFKVAMESINAAMTTMYTDGLNNGASPQGSDKLLRLRNKLYPTHFLGFGEDGLYHYETVETGGNVMPVDDDVDPGMTSGEVDILHSTESTIWNLETPTGSVPDERMYLKNVMIQSYAEHQYYDNWHVKLALKQAEAHPEIIELVGVVRDADNNMSIKYEDMSFAESGEKCFLVYTTEGTSSTNNALFAAQNGTIVNGARTSDASMWAIAEATDIECANMGDYSVFAYHQYVFVPTINMAKQYYCETTETVEDEEGNTSTVTTVVDYIDGAKAGYYHYAGGIKDGEGNEITDIEDFQTYYWTCLMQAIDLDAASEAGVHKPAEAMDIVNILNENMAALVLNRPNSDGFFRIRCVHNNHYLQSDDLNKDGRLDLSEDNTGIASIFYFDALDGEGNEGKGSLVSYKEGYYFTQGRGTDGYSGIYVCLQPIGKMGDVLTFDVPANKEFGSYNISSDNTQNQNGRRYLFGAAGNKTDGYYPDNGSDATQVNVANDLGGNTGYNWVLERVEELPLTINSYGYSTFYAPVALNVPEGVEAFICTGVDEQSELTLQSLDVIPAGTAVILKAEELAGQEVYFTEPNNTPMPLAEGENYLHGGIYKTWRTPECQNKNPEMTSATGVNHNLPYLEEMVTDKVYTLSNKNGKVAMYQYAGNKFTHFRSFLKLPEAINVALASTLDFGEIIEGPTAIEEAPAISLEDAIIYDLSGRRVAEPGKGVYIVNGKKVYFK
ncbi:MAG: hypothetical protein IKU63_02585 [Bacteroidaceae bacterium]|nr:hypothetical protein [Bacteroidaceae bacterium]